MKPRFPSRQRTHQLLSQCRPQGTPTIIRIAMVCTLLLPASMNAATSTWSGTTSADWGVAGNWDVAFANGADVILTGTTNTATYLGSNVRTVKSITFPNTAAAAFKIQLSASQNNGGATKSLTFVSGNTGITIDSGDSFAHQITGSAGGTSSLIVLQGDLAVTHNGTFPFTITRPITGAFGVIKSGSGTLIYSGPAAYSANLYTGTTTISAGTFKLGAANVLPDGAGKGNVVLNGTLDVGALSETINGLSGSGVVDNTAGGTATLTLGANDQSSTFNGVIQNTGGALAVTKGGNGTLTLTGTLTHSGATTINAGKLVGVTGGSAVNSALHLSTAAATSSVLITDNTQQWTYASLSTTDAGKLEFNFGSIAASTSVAPLQITGAADFTVTPTVSVVGANLSVGTFPLMTWASTSGTAPTALTLPAGVTGSLSVSGTTLNLVIATVEVAISKANNSDDLNLGSSWTGGNAPGASETAQWNSTVTTPNTTSLGSDITWKALKIVDPTGPVSINAGNTLTLGAGTTDIDMAAATSDLTLNCALALNGANLWDIASGRNLTLADVVSGSSTINKQGLGSVTLSGVNTFNGGITLGAGTLNLNSAEALGDAAGTLTITGGAIDNTTGGPLTLTNNNPQAWNGDFTFTGTQNLDLGTGAVTPGANRTLTITANNLTVGGPIGGGPIELTKAGVGSLTLAGTNTFSGGVTLNAGTLNLNEPSALGDAAGTFNIAGGAIDNNSAGEITLANNNPVALNANLIFAGTQNLDLGTGPVTMSAPRSITVSARNLTIGGVISGSFALSKFGNGTLHLSGLSDFSGAVVIAGPLKASSINDAGLASSLGTGSLTRIGDATTSGTLEYTGESATSTNRQIQIGTSGNGGGGATILNNNADSAHTLTFTNASFNPGATGASTSGRTLTLGGSNSGDNQIQGNIIDNALTGIPTVNLTKNGAGTWQLAGANSYTGATTVSAGTLKLGAGGVIPDGPGKGDLSLNGTLDMNTFSETVNGLSGFGTIDTVAGGTPTLTVGGNDQSSSFYGILQNTLGTLSLTKTGTGSLSLFGANTYTGDTRVSAGTLVVSGESIADTNKLILSGGTVELVADETVNTLYYGGAAQTAGTYGSSAVIPPVTFPDDTRYSGTGVLTVATTGISTGFTAWIAGTFANGPVPIGQQGPNSDPDADGVSNLIEYAITGMDPTAGDPSPGTFLGTSLSFVKRLPLDMDLNYLIEESTDLGTSDAWTAVGATNTDTGISFTLAAGPARNFMRLKVTQP